VNDFSVGGVSTASIHFADIEVKVLSMVKVQDAVADIVVRVPGPQTNAFWDAILSDTGAVVDKSDS